MKSFRLAALPAKPVLAAIIVMALLLSGGVVHAAGCFGSAIKTPRPFMGNKGEVFSLDDGSLWTVKAGYAYLYAYEPNIFLCPESQSLLIRGKTILIGRASVRKTATQERRTPRRIVTSSRLVGDLNGWQGDSRFTLDNGQVWQSDGFGYGYAYKTRPTVTIFSRDTHHEMQVEGLDSTIRVKRVR